MGFQTVGLPRVLKWWSAGDGAEWPVISDDEQRRWTAEQVAVDSDDEPHRRAPGDEQPVVNTDDDPVDS